MSQKRTLHAFFAPAAKKARLNEDTSNGPRHSDHRHYPCPILDVPQSMSKAIASLPARTGKVIKNQPHLDLLYFEPYIPSDLAKDLFAFLRSELPFYRVEYKINRGGIQTDVRTPRYTTVFGIDETARFAEDGSVVDAKSGEPVQDRRYDRYPPRPIPGCLDELRRSTETATGCTFNFCLVNYYASGADSISFHSDDERFLGPEPAIASFSLGGKRDFVLKPKPVPKGPDPDLSPVAKTLKFPLASGHMILMRGPTQSNWLHSVPKRGGRNPEDGGRINITFRKATSKDGTENYYNYNVGTGPVYRWDRASRQMRVSSSP
ncbi:2OG-Fe(II) oxygenase superfamily protein [Sodiomyces alkalinus F11]|uniref:2OG-Fe(II) oxygenase superfamily protein n=1 Tax=Sodiomyces alkalinus (strain CBS 110278 / VKM F-3762 / F11) TaxID=1314773 RepID=A0A3N2PZ88_SODAK|nr:2OG-Fe(II) oxygenase superfamily protein [Sodiomyces alkalinus F11]ROT39738.1 2OG-Fe(II) oxygenase superfamily protein [Sodiomyces alkalinus F11]